jgi:predicted GNAT family N-acyltransferase
MKPSSLTLEIAGPERREAILSLRNLTYCIELGYEAAVAEWTPLDDRACHLVAFTEDGAAVGSMRLLGPASRPFEMEQSLDLNPFLRVGHPPGEITRFCIAPAFRRISRGLRLQMGLIRLLYDASRVLQIEDVYICAKPNARKLYELLLFEALTPAEIRYGALGGDPHLLMRLEVGTLPQRYTESNHLLKGAFLEPFLVKGTQLG